MKMEKFLDHFNPHFDAIQAELGRSLESQSPFARRIADYALMAHGKRLRPLLFVLSSILCGREEQRMYRFSTIFELIHTASLLHDDVLDNAALRRNKPSVPRVWGNSAAVLGGDYLYAMATIIGTECDNIEIIKTLSEALKHMVEGQLLELSHTHDWRITQESYLDIIKAKTAVLFSAACASGALMAGAKEDRIRLGQFGLNLGIAFQLMDDILDYTSSEEEFGKPVGKDLREGKITLPLIYFLSDCSKDEVDRLQDLFKNHKANDEDYQRLIAIVRKGDILERIRARAGEYVARASSLLDPLPESPTKQDLLRLGQYILTRRH
jgi:octaprenyl-diphosphate synthase